MTKTPLVSKITAIGHEETIVGGFADELILCRSLIAMFEDALRNIRCRTGYSDSRAGDLKASHVAEVYAIADSALRNVTTDEPKPMRYTCINSDHNHASPELSWACRKATDDANDWHIDHLAKWMISQGFATGHGDSVSDLLSELAWQIAEMRDAI